MSGSPLQDAPGPNASQVAQTGANPWSPDQLAFQAWLALPPSVREPRAQRDLARQLERDPATLSQWKKLPGWHEAVYALAVRHVVSRLPAALLAQVRQAEAGSLPHMQWLAEVCGVWQPRATRHEHAGAGGGPLRIVIETVDDRRPDPA